MERVGEGNIGIDAETCERIGSRLLDSEERVVKDFEDEDVWEFPNISTKKQRAGWYVPETVQHPAKMPTYLADKIIEEYTKPGDVILDPMAGCGTTGIEAMKMGRNCIMVDYEKKFCDLMQKNIDVANKQQTLTHATYHLFWKGLIRLSFPHHMVMPFPLDVRVTLR